MTKKFLSLILFQDVCKTSIFYAEQMCKRVMSQTIPKQQSNNRRSHNQSGDNDNNDDTVNEDEAANDMDNRTGLPLPPTAAKRKRNGNGKSDFVVTPALCLAINNIDFVLEFIRPFVNELGLEEIFQGLEALNGPVCCTNLLRNC